jgi:hypothetical protein
MTGRIIKAIKFSATSKGMELMTWKFFSTNHIFLELFSSTVQLTDIGF